MKRIYNILIVGLLSIFMATLVGDAVTRYAKNKINATDPAGRAQLQALDDGWSPMVAEFYTYSTANRITIDTTNIDPLVSFQIGDKLRVDQGSGWIYMWVTAVDASGIDVDGGENYVLVNDTIDIIEFSRIALPYGWPSQTEFIKTVAAYPNTNSISSYDKQIVSFKMDGAIVTATYDYIFTMSGGGTYAFGVPLPIAGYTSTYPYNLTTQSRAQLASGLGFGSHSQVTVWGTGASSDTLIMLQPTLSGGIGYDWPTYCNVFTIPLVEIGNGPFSAPVEMYFTIVYDVRGAQ